LVGLGVLHGMLHWVLHCGGEQRIFLNLAIGAAYTPLSLSRDGKIYTENDGHLFVVGAPPDN